ncbi:hypothetical protein C8R45DRAFT_849446, partial [Mycena sanguinolenta]
RTPGNIYVCKALNWGSTCAGISVGTNTCTTLPSTWEYQIGSLGPDAGATCYGVYLDSGHSILTVYLSFFLFLSL